MSDFRYEIKYVLNESQLSHILNLIKHHGFKKQYPQRTVCSLYFEDYNFSSVKDNLSGISKRKKLRLRWYEDDTNPPFLEIKKRSGRIGSKVKIITPFKNGDEVEKMNSREILNKLNSKNKVHNELITYPNLEPILLVNYKRDYFISKEGVRLTIDKKIKFSSVNKFNSINFQKKINYNENIVEIKFPIQLKESLNTLLKKTELIPTRHSKYLVGLSKLGFASYI
jgi:SPX domain protein involved in polyphosphate accumulation